MENMNENIGKIIEGFKILKFLGKGKFSVVYQAERQSDMKLVALKIIKAYEIKDKESYNKCLKEVNLLKSVNHPNIVKFLDSFSANNELYIVIEWADKGDVRKLIKKYKQEGDLLEESKIVEYIREIASGLVHMHEKRIIHRDLKPANILIFSDGTLKLGDLGLGRDLNKESIKAFSRVGTPLYMAPEVIKNEGYDFRSDYWSLGCVIYELITLRSPFQVDGDITVIELFNKIKTGNYPKIKDNKYKFVVGITEGLMKVNPEERVDLKEVITKCEGYLKNVEEKPRIDPFIVMEDIIEKLRLIDYENNYCKKYNIPLINKYYFACSVNGYGNTDDKINDNKQFEYFYNLCNWMIEVINQNINISALSMSKLNVKFYDVNSDLETQMNELIYQLKNMGIKVLQNSKFKYGYGEGICLVLTQLCDKYLIKQNYIFKRPKFKTEENISKKIKDDSNKNYDRIMLEDKIGTQIGFKANTNYNFGINFKGRLRNNKNKDIGKKRFNSAFSSTSNNNESTTDFSANDDDNRNTLYNILNTTIEPSEWKKELMRVEKSLVISEEPEFLESMSGSDLFNVNCSNNNNFKIIKKINMYNSFYKGLHPFYDGINIINQKIDIQLNNINKYENVLDKSKNLKPIFDKIRLTNSAIKGYKQDIKDVENNINVLQSTKNNIENKLKKCEYKNDNLNNENSIYNIEKMKKSIQLLNKENKRLCIQENIYNNYLFSSMNKQNDINIEEDIQENILFDDNF